MKKYSQFWTLNIQKNAQIWVLNTLKKRLNLSIISDRQLKVTPSIKG